MKKIKKTISINDFKFYTCSKYVDEIVSNLNKVIKSAEELGYQTLTYYGQNNKMRIKKIVFEKENNRIDISTTTSIDGELLYIEINEEYFSLKRIPKKLITLVLEQL